MLLRACCQITFFGGSHKSGGKYNKITSMAVEGDESLILRYKCSCLSVTDLPEEILEYILSQLSPYQDLKAAKQVCKQWHRLVLGNYGLYSL